MTVGRREGDRDVDAEGVHRVLQARVLLNSCQAEARAFVALDTGEVQIYSALWYYHSTEPKLLEGEFHFSKPLRASAAQRMSR